VSFMSYVSFVLDVNFVLYMGVFLILCVLCVMCGAFFLGWSIAFCIHVLLVAWSFF
jgi:hypothetical protein